MALVGTWREQGRGRRGCRTRGGRAQNARASCAAGAGVVRQPRHFCLFLFRLFSCWLAVARCGVVACVSACCSMRVRVPACVHAAACLLVHVHPSPCDHHTHNHWTQQSKVRGQRQQRAGGDTRRPVHARLHTSDGRCPSRVYALFSTPYSLHPFPPSPTLDPPPQNALSHPRPSPAPETLSVSSVCARTRSHSLTHSLVHTHTHTHIHTHTHTQQMHGSDDMWGYGSGEEESAASAAADKDEEEDEETSRDTADPPVPAHLRYISAPMAPETGRGACCAQRQARRTGGAQHALAPRPLATAGRMLVRTSTGGRAQADAHRRTRTGGRAHMVRPCRARLGRVSTCAEATCMHSLARTPARLH